MLKTFGDQPDTTSDAGDDEFCAHQYGPRRLWDEVEAAHRWWAEHGRPDIDRWRFTVTPPGQRIALLPSG